jgi:DnaJ family protein C protein 25
MPPSSLDVAAAVIVSFLVLLTAPATSKIMYKLLVSLLLLACTLQVTAAQQEQASASDEQQAQPPSEQQQNAPTFNAKQHMDWGTYYDPQNVFCGKYDCYAILGFDYENFGQPPEKEITKRYRALSRLWHPDKNKGNKEAKDRFVKIARAYEVLTNEALRNQYDVMRYDQDLYHREHGSGVLWTYAPKTDAVFVVFVLLSVGSALSWFIQKSKWQQVADRLVQASVEDWGPREGGTPESKELRDKAMEILAQQEAEAEQQNANGTDNASKKSKKKQKLTTSEKRKQQQDALRPIVAQLVDDAHDDFGAGFHKPTWKDLLVVKIVKFPYVFGTGLYWNLKYFARRLMKIELSEEERQVLTARAVGDIAWHSASEEERKDWMARDLWITANMIDWEEEQEVKQLSPSEQKRYNRMKKKGKKIDWDYKED